MLMLLLKQQECHKKCGCVHCCGSNLSNGAFSSVFHRAQTDEARVSCLRSVLVEFVLAGSEEVLKYFYIKDYP